MSSLTPLAPQMSSNPVPPLPMNSHQLKEAFITFALQCGALKFGEFVTKAGRVSPYFFNAGLFQDGASLARLGDFYAQTLLASGIAFDMLFGPAYKGIALAVSTASALASYGKNVPLAFNRKEAKDHGEGGTLIGAPLKGRVVIIDDVISAGTSVAQSMQLIKRAQAEAAAVLIALDRQERGEKDGVLSNYSAVQEVQRQYDIPVLSIANLDDMLNVAERAPIAVLAADEFKKYRTAIENYRLQYGIK